jgi:hypothetical protein
MMKNSEIIDKNGFADGSQLKTTGGSLLSNIQNVPWVPRGRSKGMVDKPSETKCAQTSAKQNTEGALGTPPTSILTLSAKP